MTSAFRLLAGALLFSATVAASGASRAGEGGQCCGEAGERLEELLATRVAKEARPMSLMISGWVNEAVFFWDDGVEQNAYVGTNGLEQSRFRISGEAAISARWAAGAFMEVNIFGANSANFSQAATGAPNVVNVNKANWYVRSRDLGRMIVGLESTATEHLLDDADFTMTRPVSDVDATRVSLAQFRSRIGGALQTFGWADILSPSTPGQSGVRNVLRYESPVVAGTSVTTTWNADSEWSGKLDTRGEYGDLSFLVQLGGGASTDAGNGQCNAPGLADCSWWGGAGTVMHTPTGLYLYGGYGTAHDHAEKAFNAAADSRDVTWFLQAGVEHLWIPAGKTNIFAEYRRDEAGSNLGTAVTLNGAAGFLRSADADFWSVGAIQAVDAAALTVYAVYRHAEGEVTDSNGAAAKLDDFDMVITGIKMDF